MSRAVSDLRTRDNSQPSSHQYSHDGDTRRWRLRCQPCPRLTTGCPASRRGLDWLEAVFAVQRVLAQFGSAVHSRRGPQRLPSGRRSAGFRQSRVGRRGWGVVPIVRCMSDCCVAPNQASAERSPCASSPTTLAVCNSLAAENACAPTRRAAAPSRMARGRRARTGQLCVESTTASGPGGYAPAVSRGRPWTVH